MSYEVDGGRDEDGSNSLEQGSVLVAARAVLRPPGPVSERFARARALLGINATEQDRDVQCALGDLYLGQDPFGDLAPEELSGVVPDPKGINIAIGCYRKAEALGDNRARFALALLFLNETGDRGEVAEALLKLCARDGNPRALQTLGEMYRHGIGVAQNSAKALNALRAAAVARQPAACHMLGVMLWNGEAGPPEHVEAYCWIIEAAALGNGADSEALVEELTPQLSDIEHAMVINLLEDWAAERDQGGAVGEDTTAVAETHRRLNSPFELNDDNIEILRKWREEG